MCLQTTTNPKPMNHDPAAAGSPPPMLPSSPLEANFHAMFKDRGDKVIAHHPLACRHIAMVIDSGIIQRCAVLHKPKFCGKRTQQPTCSFTEADLNVVLMAGGE